MSDDCYTCGKPIGDVSFHPGREYGPTALAFCSDEHMAAWQKTLAASAMAFNYAMSRILRPNGEADGDE